jgi:hypothetical protein
LVFAESPTALSVSGGREVMDKLFELIGLALPDTPTILRLKALLAGGVGGIGAGVMFMLSGVEGSLVWGAAMMICGLSVIGITVRSFVNEHRKYEADRLAERRQREAEAQRTSERLAREAACERHQWVLDDSGLDFDVYRYVCARCGAARPN